MCVCVCFSKKKKKKKVDENQQALKNPLHVPVGSITRVRSKKIKEAFNGLIIVQDILSLAQKKMKA